MTSNSLFFKATDADEDAADFFGSQRPVYVGATTVIGEGPAAVPVDPFALMSGGTPTGGGAPAVVETTDAAASSATTYTLGVGQQARGTVSSSGEHDWFKVDLVNGQTYTFSLVATGGTYLVDPFLSLVGTDGVTVLASDDDGLPNLNSTITFTATSTGSYWLNAGGYSTGTGQYGLAATLGTKGSFDSEMIAGVLDTHQTWAPSRGGGATITYGFRDTYSGPEQNFSQVGAAQQEAVQRALGIFSEITGIVFQHVNPGGYTNDATILISDYNNPGDGAGAYAYYPGSTASSSVAGDLWLNTSVSTSSLPYGSYSFFAIMHELGHALGLSHPGLYNAGPGVSITYAANAQFVQDSRQFSMMSYFGAGNTGGTQGGYGDSPMLYDIAALQLIYGANMTTRSGDTIYGFGSNAGDLYDFASNTLPALSIWDAGGADTFNASLFTMNQIIDLRSGNFSNIGGLISNISIAFGATIENAVGGIGDDTIYGNHVANTLNGGSGIDAMRGGLGDDIYVVDSYSDATIENSGEGTDTVQTALAQYILNAANVENLTFAGGGNFAGAGNGLDNRLTGGAGNDWLSGEGGSDTIDGGLGGDLMFGGLGDDTFTVDSYSDTVVENLDEGTDAVQTTLAQYILANNVENAAFTGVGNFAAGGNSLDNVLTGGAGNDWLAGYNGNDTFNAGGGNDVMFGGFGDDRFVVDSYSDAAVENIGEGTDTVTTALSQFILGSNLENLTFTGAGNFAGGGNGLVNSLTGGSGDDWLAGYDGGDFLNGGGGADVMFGGLGDDTFTVDSYSDAVIENGGEGTDTVGTTLSQYILGANIENASFLGSGNFAVAGNALNNYLNGGSGDDWMQGNGGVDSYVGGRGSDLMIAGSGQDTFIYIGGETGLDTIVGFNATMDKFMLNTTAYSHTVTFDIVQGPGATAPISANTTFIYDSTSGALTYDSNGTGAGGQYTLAVIGAGLTLTNANFQFT